MLHKLFVAITVLSFTKLLAFGQADPPKKDNYTVQNLHIFNHNGDILLQKNQYGWNTIAMRANANQSVRESLDSLAATIGLSIDSVSLAGLYTYKFEGLPDHREVAFRTHYIARLKSGDPTQASGVSGIAYRWTPVKEAMEAIAFEPAKVETAQILKYPGTVWGGSFLIIWEGDNLTGTKILEQPYPLSF